MNIEQINESIVKQLSNEANIAMTKSFLLICTIFVAVSNRCQENFLYKTVAILFDRFFKKRFLSAINKITCYTSVNKDFLTCVGCILGCHYVASKLLTTWEPRRPEPPWPQVERADLESAVEKILSLNRKRKCHPRHRKQFVLAEVVEKTMLMENLLLTVVGQMLLRETLLHAIALNEIVAFPEIKLNLVISKTISVILNF